jgi:hypothetical protein
MTLSQRLKYSYSSGFCYKHTSVHSHVGALKFSVFCRAKVPQTDKPSRTNRLLQVSTLQKRDQHISPQPCLIHRNLHYVIFSFRCISVFPMLSRASLAFRPEFADTPGALSKNLHSSIEVELKRLKASSVSLFARSVISILTHITACTADIAHAFISCKMVAECSVSWRAMLSGSVTLVA